VKELPFHVGQEITECARGPASSGAHPLEHAVHCGNSGCDGHCELCNGHRMREAFDRMSWIPARVHTVSEVTDDGILTTSGRRFGRSECAMFCRALQPGDREAALEYQERERLLVVVRQMRWVDWESLSTDDLRRLVGAIERNQSKGGA
jgi:hypothetical protein